MFADKGLVVAQYFVTVVSIFVLMRFAMPQMMKTGRHWFSLGIFRPESFFNSIKQRFGMTPGEYRRKFR